MLHPFIQAVCPVDCPDDAFYLKPLTVKRADGCWFSKQPLGHNILANVVKRMCSSPVIHGYKTKHSTSASRLYHKGIDEQLIMEWTGHHSLEGIQSYKRMSTEQVMVLSDILNRENSNKRMTIDDAFSSVHQLLQYIYYRLNYLYVYYILIAIKIDCPRLFSQTL